MRPDAFAAVMATGIVSFAAADHGVNVVSAPLAVVAAVALPVLIVATARAWKRDSWNLPSGPQSSPDKQSRVGSGGWPDEEGPILADPGCTSGGNVAFLVANEDRTVHVEIEITGGGKDQSRLGFATLAVSLRGIDRQRMVGT
ncbi:MAG TPA: hypothetical protein VGO30_24685 [Mycobacterium sp.]|nr:hypothetical protein [Mycobacterium sp.]